MQHRRAAVDYATVPTFQWFHATALLSPMLPDLSREDTGGWLWTHSRETFPRALAVTIMPNHPHIVLPSADPEADRQRLARLLGQFGRKFGAWGRMSIVPPLAVIRTRELLARQVRYVALNPCRARLVACPLAWPWSTHRDVVGATLDPWVTAERLAAALGDPARGFVARHHAYVSGDPRARIEGTPLPIAPERTDLPAFSLRNIAEAVACATRAPLDAVRSRGASRALFVALAFDQGWGHVPLLARTCGCSPRAITRLANAVDEDALLIARLCLGDARLRRVPEPVREPVTSAQPPQHAHSARAKASPLDNRRAADTRRD